MTTIIIFKLHIWRMYTQFINEDWMTIIIIFIFKLHIWRTHNISMMTERPLSLFSNYTIIIIFKLHTHLTYDRTHSVSMRTEWPLSLFSNSAFDVHIYTVYQWGLNDCYNYFQTTHTFDVFSIKLKNYTHFTYVYAVMPMITHCCQQSQQIFEWIDYCLVTDERGVKETKNHNRLLYLSKSWNFTHISINFSPCELRDDDSFLAVCSF